MEKNKFYEFSKLEEMLNNNRLGVSFFEIQTYLMTSKITITYEDIDQFMFERAKEEDIDLDKEITSSNLSGSTNNLTDEKLEEYQKAVDEDTTRRKFDYSKYDLKYFKKFTDILREKGLHFCKVANLLSYDEIRKAGCLLPDYALNIKDSKIDLDSIERLVEAILVCYEKVKEMTDTANNLETYLTKNVLDMDSLGGVYMAPAGGGIIREEQLYPTTEYQLFEISYQANAKWAGCLELSPKQLENVKTRDRNNRINWMKKTLGTDETKEKVIEKVFS